MSSFETEGRNLCLVAARGPGGSSGPGVTSHFFAEKILALLDQIRAMDVSGGKLLPEVVNRQEPSSASSACQEP
jgi:hypothetical protein